MWIRFQATTGQKTPTTKTSLKLPVLTLHFLYSSRSSPARFYRSTLSTQRQNSLQFCNELIFDVWMCASHMSGTAKSDFKPGSRFLTPGGTFNQQNRRYFRIINERALIKSESGEWSTVYLKIDKQKHAPITMTSLALHLYWNQPCCISYPSFDIRNFFD